MICCPIKLAKALSDLQNRVFLCCPIYKYIRNIYPPSPAPAEAEAEAVPMRNGYQLMESEPATANQRQI